MNPLGIRITPSEAFQLCAVHHDVHVFDNLNFHCDKNFFNLTNFFFLILCKFHFAVFGYKTTSRLVLNLKYPHTMYKCS